MTEPESELRFGKGPLSAIAPCLLCEVLLVVNRARRNPSMIFIQESSVHRQETEQAVLKRQIPLFPF